MRVVGIDLSMTSTGIAVIERHDFDNGPAGVRLHRIESKPLPAAARTGLNGNESLKQRTVRLSHITDQVYDVVAAGHDEVFVVIEGPSYGSKGSAFHQVAGLWWMVVDLITRSGLHLTEVSPSTRMVYATGKGNAGKDAVMLAAARRYDAYAQVNGNDQADALILAAMGARHLGSPLEDTLPKTHLRAMDAVAWPAIKEVANE